MMIDMIHFDTLKYAETLIMAGMPEAQAKALSKAQHEAMSTCLEKSFPEELATKNDLMDVRNGLKAEIAEVKSDIVLLKADVHRLDGDVKTLKWMSGFSLTGIMTILAGMLLMMLEHYG